MAWAVCPITISAARSRVDAGALASSVIFNNSPSSRVFLNIQEERAVWREMAANVFPNDSELCRVLLRATRCIVFAPGPGYRSLR